MIVFLFRVGGGVLANIGKIKTAFLMMSCYNCYCLMHLVIGDGGVLEEDGDSFGVG